MQTNLIYKYILICLSTVMPFYLSAQEAAVLVVESNQGVDIYLILSLIILILLVPLYYASKNFIFIAKDHVERKKTGGSTKSYITLAIAMGLSQITNAQAANTQGSSFDWTLWTLITCIAMEIILILYFLSQSTKFLQSSQLINRPAEVESRSWFANMWDNINSFKPLEAEADIDTGHNYDGIRELDNVTPPWFTTAFIGTIIFAAIYMYRYHVSHSAPLQIEEYKNEMAIALKEELSLLSLQANKVDENSVTLLSGGDIENGKTLFVEKCMACHETHGGSKPGGVGPNLTDNHWIHGGSINDIFKTIKYGYPEKGMISWKDQLSSYQIAQVSSFIKSIKGSNPPNAKDPEGELYEEKVSVGAKTDTMTIDTKKNK